MGKPSVSTAEVILEAITSDWSVKLFLKVGYILPLHYQDVVDNFNFVSDSWRVLHKR